jgi:hypothetical protein
MTDESYITSGPGHTTFVGPDATKLFAAATLRTAIGFYIKTKMQVNRAYTPTAMRAAAGRITGKSYKRSELAKAEADLSIWIEAMKAALPVVTEPTP